MTQTSKERREVAERIRALPSDIYSTIKEWEKDGLFIDATLCDEADYSQIHNAVFGCFPPEYIHPGDREELHERLADLIDPTCHLLPSSDGGYGCDRCYTWFPSMKEKTNYCPECGARVVSSNDTD